jgi:hypothetical protein
MRPIQCTITSVSLLGRSSFRKAVLPPLKIHDQRSVCLFVPLLMRWGKVKFLRPLGSMDTDPAVLPKFGNFVRFFGKMQGTPGRLAGPQVRFVKKA